MSREKCDKCGKSVESGKTYAKSNEYTLDGFACNECFHVMLFPESFPQLEQADNSILTGSLKPTQEQAVEPIDYDKLSNKFHSALDGWHNDSFFPDGKFEELIDDLLKPYQQSITTLQLRVKELESQVDELKKKLQAKHLLFENEVAECCTLTTENKRLREALDEQIELWGEVKEDLNRKDDGLGRVRFMEFHDPIKKATQALDVKERKADE